MPITFCHATWRIHERTTIWRERQPDIRPDGTHLPRPFTAISVIGRTANALILGLVYFPVKN